MADQSRVWTSIASLELAAEIDPRGAQLSVLRDHAGRDETRHLEPLDRILEAGKTPAEELLEKFNGPWAGSVEPAYTEYAF